MKHIKLFESFKKVNENISEREGFVFDWMPFDNEINNPLNSQMSAEVTYPELIKLSTEAVNEASSIGLYMSHKKLGDGGFIRLVTTSINPLIFTVATFDKEFKKISEHEGIDADKFDPSSYIKGSDIMSRFRY